MERLLSDEEPFVVLDSGQAAFVPLTRYLVESQACRMLEEHGRACFVHTVVTGGQLGPSTLEGLSDVLAAFSGEAKLAVWHNEHFGPIDQSAYQEVVERVGGRVLGPIDMHRWSQLPLRRIRRPKG